VLEEEAVSRKASVSRYPTEESIEIIHSSFDNWAGSKRYISRALEQRYRDSPINSRWQPSNIERLASRDDLISSWRNNIVEDLSDNR